MRLQQYIIENTEYEVKHISGKSKIKTTIKPEDRTYDNIPKDSKGKNKCRFQDWLCLTGNPGKAANGRWYGYSHRAIASFGIGDTITSDNMAHKDYKWDDDKKTKHKSYKIKTDKEAREHADRFRKNVS